MVNAVIADSLADAAEDTVSTLPVNAVIEARFAETPEETVSTLASNAVVSAATLAHFVVPSEDNDKACPVDPSLPVESKTLSSCT